MINCNELNKSFETKELLFAELKANKELILAEKKSQIQKSCDKGNTLISRSISIAKSLEAIKDFDVDDNFYYIAVNSTNILDSHKDLHLKGIWNKTVKEQQGKNYLVADHELKLLSTIANKEDIEMFTQMLPFSAIGKTYKGETEVLIYKVAKAKVRESYKEFLEGNIEASVRMQYVSINLAMKSTSKGDESELKTYMDNIDLIANKEDFEDEILYFFTVSEAKNVKESSLVLFGSNESTGMIQAAKALKKTIEPIIIITQKTKRRY